jgi:putative Holliday junction resolvase
MSELGRIMGLDVGEARTGIAMSDPLQMIASPHDTLPVKSDAADAAALAQLARAQEVIRIVVGLPLNQHGERGPQAEKVLRFAEALRAATDVEVVLQDERFSTVAATRSLQASGVKGKKRKGSVDKVAAAHILQTYLDRTKAQARHGG